MTTQNTDSALQSAVSCQGWVEQDDNYYGTGPYYNILKSIVMKSNIKGNALYAGEMIPKGTIVWTNRALGPAELSYHRVKLEDVSKLGEKEKEIFIRYGYQQTDDLFITPLTEEEIKMDYSNYWNHSCNPNCLPLNEDQWIAIKDIGQDEELTIDYCTFDSNPYNCIDECLCGTTECRKYILNDAYKCPKIQKKYGNHFVPYILNKIKELNKESASSD